jgi:hypothetical protein
MMNLFIFSSMLFLGCPSPDKDRETEDKNVKNPHQNILEYYKTQGIMTEPGQYAYLYKDLPSDVEKLVEIVQGTMIHIFHAHRHGVKLSEERKKEVQIRKVEKMLERIIELDNRPIIQARDPEKRLVGNCRDYSVFLCSLLRHKGIPARARCGFATYFPTGKKMTHEDHWICEYWKPGENRWIQADAQIDNLQKRAFRLKFDTLDMPQGKFLSSGKVWKLTRTGKLDPNLCGIFDLKGLWFISGNLARDFMALNKVEVLPWDSNKLIDSLDKQLSPEEYALLDEMAEITTAGDNSFSEVRSLYESNSALRMPADWEP